MNRRTVWAVTAAAVAETAATWARAGKPGGELIVRCRDGHLFTTLWIPAASIKSLRLGWWRLQYCPVGHHWTVVTPVRESELSLGERRRARQRHDIPVP